MIEKEINGFGFTAGRWPLDTEKSTIVFLHGSGGSSRFWAAQMRGLTERVNTVALDMPGHGRSGSKGKNTIGDYARAVVEFMDSIDMPKAIPCGLSLGGAVVQHLLLDFANRFSGGILIGTGARLKVLPAIFEAIEKDYTGFVEMAGKLASSEKTDTGLSQPFRDDLFKCKPEVTYGDFQACDRFNVMGRLHEISVPVLVISAEGDKLTPPKYAQFLKDGIPNAVRKHIQDAGHIAPMEKPREVNQAIVEFLDRHGF
jgi:pimeloyl-ACP methyl ester carboxylesterase